MDTKHVDCAMAEGDFVKVNATNNGSIKRIYVSCVNLEGDVQPYSESDVSLTVDKAEALINHLKEAIAFVKGE